MVHHFNNILSFFRKIIIQALPNRGQRLSDEDQNWQWLFGAWSITSHLLTVLGTEWVARASSICSEMFESTETWWLPDFIFSAYLHFPHLTFNGVDVKVLCVSGVILKYSNYNTDRSSLVTEISDFLLIFMLRAISSVPCTCEMLMRVSLNACSKASE